VHKGFLKAYNSIRTELLPLLRQYAQEYYSEDASGNCTETPLRIITSGHSLGGALATVCAVDLASTDYVKSATVYEHGPSEPPADQCVSSYSLGCPRVGNHDFAAYAREKVPSMYRCVDYVLCV
jgi:predicted lipase